LAKIEKIIALFDSKNKKNIEKYREVDALVHMIEIR